jgi:hypothetical protein
MIGGHCQILKNLRREKKPSLLDRFRRSLYKIITRATGTFFFFYRMKSCTLRRLLCSHFCREYDCSNNCWLLIIPPVGIRRLATTVTRGNHLMRPAGAEGWSRFPEIAPEKSMMKGTRRFTKYIWAPGNNSRKNVPSHTYQRVLFFNSLTKNMFSSRRALLPTYSNAKSWRFIFPCIHSL